MPISTRKPHAYELITSVYDDPGCLVWQPYEYNGSATFPDASALITLAQQMLATVPVLVSAIVHDERGHVVAVITRD